MTVVGVFGSLARNEHAPAAEVDLLIGLGRPVGLELVDVAGFLEQRLGRKVDLLSRRAARARLWKAIEPELVAVESGWREEPPPS